jgi:hypothetical protein
MPEPRTADQIRAEIQAERAQLDASVGELKDSARHTGRLAGSVLAGVSGLLVFVKLVARLRR